MNPIRLPRYSFAAAFLAFAFGLTGQALAHAHLRSETPAANATVASPHELRLRFSEGLELAFTTVKLTGPRGEVATGSPALDPQDKAVLIVPLTAALDPGRYTVHWHATAADTHKTEGVYGFTVKP